MGLLIEGPIMRMKALISNITIGLILTSDLALAAAITRVSVNSRGKDGNDESGDPAQSRDSIG
jgi:hypothetical protein